MRLTQVEMIAFRSWRGLTLPLDTPRILIAGLNGTGKSSVRDAIRWALTGRCSGLDGRGAGAEVLIPEGSKTAEVAITIDGIGRVARSYAEHGGGAFSVAGFTGTSQIQQQALYIKLQTTPEFLDAVLDTSIFLDLNHVEAKAMVLSLLGVKIRVVVEPRKTEDGIVEYSLDELDLHYKQAFEDRKLAKRNLQQAVLPAKPEASGMPTAEVVETKLAALRAELGVAQQDAGATIGRRQTLTSQIKHWNVVEPEPVEEDLTPQITALESALAAQDSPPPVQTPPKVGDPARVTFLRTQADALKAHTPAGGCVLDSKVACLTPKKQFQMGAGDVEKELKGLTTQEPQKPVESPQTALRLQLADLQKRQAQRAARIEQAQQEKERLDGLRQELDALPETATAEAAIATLQTRIGKGEQLLRDARTHWNAVSAYEKAVASNRVAKQEVDRLEALVETLGPKGVRVQALGEAMGKFEAAVNPYVSAFGWMIRFSVEPWEVFANDRPVETYSRSERYRIGIALQLAIAQLSGLNFAVVDEIDMLDVANRGIVSKMLSSAPLEQILILGTREPSQPLPKISGILTYRLAIQDGQTVIAERSAE